MDTATMPPRLGPLKTKCNGPDPVDIHVGRKIIEARIIRGISQEKLADAIGLTFQQVQKYERGANRVSASKLYRIADALGVSVTFFFAGLGSTDRLDEDARLSVSIARYYQEIPDLAGRQLLMALARRLAKEPQE